MIARNWTSSQRTGTSTAMSCETAAVHVICRRRLPTCAAADEAMDA